MKAIILVAGVSRRLFPRTREVPKRLLPVGGRSIPDYQLSALEQAGIHDVVLVVGYRREQVMEAVQERCPPSAGWRITYVVNRHFFDTNTAHSLWLAGDWFLGQDFLYLNGDVLFPKELIDRVIDSAYPTALAMKRVSMNPGPARLHRRYLTGNGPMACWECPPLIEPVYPVP